MTTSKPVLSVAHRLGVAVLLVGCAPAALETSTGSASSLEPSSDPTEPAPPDVETGLDPDTSDTQTETGTETEETGGSTETGAPTDTGAPPARRPRSPSLATGPTTCS